MVITAFILLDGEHDWAKRLELIETSMASVYLFGVAAQVWGTRNGLFDRKTGKLAGRENKVLSRALHFLKPWAL